MKARGWLLASACALVLTGVTIARPASTWGPPLRDLEAYWSAGQTYDSGGDPYGRDIWNVERTVPGVDPTHEEVLPFVSPPATLLVFGALARLPFDAVVRIWYAMLVLSIGGLIVVSLRASNGRVTFVSFLAGSALALGFGPVTGNLALGQIAIAGFLAAAIAAASESTPVVALSSLIAFSQPNVALGLISQLSSYRKALAMAAAAVVSYLAGVAVMGWDWPLRYAALVRLHDASERGSAIQITPRAIAHGLHASPSIETIVAIVAAFLAACAAVAIWRAVGDRFARFAAFSTLLPFVATFFHEHDLVVAFPAAIWCAVRTSGAARIAGLLGMAFVAIDWLGLSQRSNGVLQSALLATAAVAAFAALGEDFEIATVVRAVVPVGALFAVAAWLGSANPLPVWPYHLGSFHPLATLPISTVWMQEQQQNGILAIVPTWSALRALSLLGCALLAYAIYLHFRSRRTESTLQHANR